MQRKRSNAFITARKGFCYLTIKYARRNHEMMRIRNYRIDADEKRRMRRLYPEVAFDWKKISRQLAEKREACRRYRSRRRNPDTARHPRGREPFYGVRRSGREYSQKVMPFTLARASGSLGRPGCWN
jgi:hypothetical protein